MLKNERECLEADFWQHIRDRICEDAEDEMSECFLNIVRKSVQTMGPSQLMALYLEYNK